jgi:hypothetical protein
MIILGIIGILQALILPGLVITILFAQKIPINWVDKLLFSTPLSILLNYIIVCTLVYFNIYGQIELIFIVFMEISVIILFISKEIRYKSNMILMINFMEIYKNSISYLYERKKILFQWLLMLFSFCWLAVVFFHSSNTNGIVFSLGDAVVSWNRWGKEWFNQAPGPSWGYPPGLPILYSLVYKLVGINNIQIFAKIMVSYYPFFGLFCCWRIGYLDQILRWASAISGIIFIYLIISGNNDSGFIFSGHADVLLASLAAFMMYGFILFKHLFHDKNFNNKSIFLFSLLCVFGFSSAAIIKQPGVILALLAICFFLVEGRSFFLTYKYKSAFLSTLFIFLIFHWYFYSYFRWNDYVRATDLMSHNVLQRMLLAAKLTIYVVGLPVALLFLYGIVSSRNARILTAFMLLPLWTFWAIVASYDFRSAYPLIPGVAFVASLGIVATFLSLKNLQQLFNKTFVIKLKNLIFFLFAVTIFLTVTIFIKFPNEEILKINFKHLAKSNDQGFNSMLVDIFSVTSNQEKLISCYQMPYNLPGAEGKFIGVGDCNAAYFEWTNSHDVKYYLAAPNEAGINKARKQSRNSFASFKYSEIQLPNGFILYTKDGNF